MGALPQTLEIIFEMYLRKGVMKKQQEKNKFPTYKTHFFPFSLL